MNLQQVIKMKKNYKYLIFIIIPVIIFILFKKIDFMGKNKQKALIFYSMDYQRWDSSFRKKLVEGDENYKTWFLKNSKEINIPDSIYKEVFITNPLISSGITNTLLDESQHLFTDTNAKKSNFIYFIVRPEPYLRLLKNSISEEYKNNKIDSFTYIFKEIEEKKIYVLAEFDKRNSWFDYDKIFNQKQKFKQQHELEIKEHEESLSK